MIQEKRVKEECKVHDMLVTKVSYILKKATVYCGENNGHAFKRFTFCCHLQINRFDI